MYFIPDIFYCACDIIKTTMHNVLFKPKTKKYMTGIHLTKGMKMYSMLFFVFAE